MQFVCWRSFRLGRLGIHSQRHSDQSPNCPWKERPICRHWWAPTPILSGRYPFERYVIFNFAMKGSAPVLPRSEEHHDKVYTYLHDTNSLYRGNKCIKAPAVKRLSCESPWEGIAFTLLLIFLLFGHPGIWSKYVESFWSKEMQVGK